LAESGDGFRIVADGRQVVVKLPRTTSPSLPDRIGRVAVAGGPLSEYESTVIPAFHAAVSPDGARLVYRVRDNADPFSSFLYQLDLVNVESWRLDDPTGQVRGVYLNPDGVFTPDGDRVLFIADMAGIYELFVNDLQGTENAADAG
jgi:Tol biopolymer transport system component